MPENYEAYKHISSTLQAACGLDFVLNLYEVPKDEQRRIFEKYLVVLHTLREYEEKKAKKKHGR